jgi:hypothetical protein
MIASKRPVAGLTFCLLDWLSNLTAYNTRLELFDISD